MISFNNNLLNAYNSNKKAVIQPQPYNPFAEQNIKTINMNNLELPSDIFVNNTESKEEINSSNNKKFDVGEAALNFGKGLISPITSMFSSPQNFVMGAGMMAAAGALTVATGGAILPFMAAAGIATGVFQAGTAAYKIATAKDGDDVEKAFYDIGAAATTLIPSIAGAKTVLKQANIAADVSKMNTFEAVIQTFKETPSSLAKSFNAFKDGSAWINLKAQLPFINKKTKVEDPKPVNKEVEAKQKAEIEAKQKAEIEAKQKAEIEAKQKAEIEAKQKAEIEAKQKAEIKAKQKAEIEAKQKAEIEAKQKAEIEAKQKAEIEAKQKAEIEAKQKADEAKRIAKSEAMRKRREDFISDLSSEQNGYKPLNKSERANLNQQFKEQYKDSFSKQELDAMTKYKGDYYQDINPYARKTGAFDAEDILTQPAKKLEQLDNIVNNLDKVIERSECPQDVVVYRGVAKKQVFPEAGGVEYKYPYELKEGMIYTDNGYTSTSYDPKEIMAFNGYGDEWQGYSLKIKVPKGAKALDIESTGVKGISESELLLPRNSQFKVVKVDQNTGIVELELMVEEAHKPINLSA